VRSLGADARSLFTIIDIAARPEVYYQRGQEGRFIGRSGNSWRPGKSKFFLSLLPKAVRQAWPTWRSQGEASFGRINVGTSSVARFFERGAACRGRRDIGQKDGNEEKQERAGNTTVANHHIQISAGDASLATPRDRTQEFRTTTLEMLPEGRVVCPPSDSKRTQVVPNNSRNRFLCQSRPLTAVEVFLRTKSSRLHPHRPRSYPNMRG
jgi:hypothetical protein